MNIQINTTDTKNLEKNLKKALEGISESIGIVNLDEDVKNNTIDLYIQAAEYDLVKGRSYKDLLASSFYISCRKKNVPISLDDISDATGIPSNKVLNTSRCMCRKLEIGIDPPPLFEYVSRFCSELNLSSDVEEEAINILEEAKENGIVAGKKPTGLAATAIYLAALRCGEYRSQIEISDVASTTDVTIRSNKKLILDELPLDI